METKKRSIKCPVIRHAGRTSYKGRDKAENAEIAGYVLEKYLLSGFALFLRDAFVCILIPCDFFM